MLLMFVGAALIGGLIHYGVLRDAGPGTTSTSAGTTTSTSSADPAVPGSPASPVEPGDASTAASSSSSATGPASDTTTDTATNTAVTAAHAATCWDGTTAGRVAGCTLPAGQAGLHWVFPSLDAADHVSCQPARSAAGAYDVVVGLECFTRIDGQPVRINYEQLASLGRARTTIDGTYTNGARYDFPGARGGRRTWFDSDAHPSRVTGYYRGFPYAVSVTSPSGRITKQAWVTLVTMRDAADIRGVRT